METPELYPAAPPRISDRPTSSAVLKSKPRQASHQQYRQSIIRMSPPLLATTLLKFMGAIAIAASGSMAIASPATAGILSPGQILKPGDCGAQIGALQRQLRDLGLFNQANTSCYDTPTQTAVFNYQNSILGLRADGIFGSRTDAALFDQNLRPGGSVGNAQIASTLPTVPVSNTTSSLGSRVLRRGDRGSDVSELQRLLSDRIGPIAIDGVFGARTEAQVRNFQRFQGLVPDGIVGSQTFTALGVPYTGSSGVFSTFGSQPITIPGNSQVFANPQATFSAATINRGPYIVIVPADADDDQAKLAWVRTTQPLACMARSRRGSYIFAGGYPEYSNAESMRLLLLSKRPDTNTARTHARVDYRGGDFTVECLY